MATPDSPSKPVSPPPGPPPSFTTGHNAVGSNSTAHPEGQEASANNQSEVRPAVVPVPVPFVAPMEFEGVVPPRLCSNPVLCSGCALIILLLLCVVIVLVVWKY